MTSTELIPVPTTNPSGPVLREYSTPTCKLQISANPSALEKWTRKPTLKNQRFLLSFQDPRLSEDQWITLRGDRLKLAALTEAVTTYVQSFLSQSRTVSYPPHSPIELLETPISDSETDSAAQPSPEPSTQGISLQPRGLLAHTLNLGTIATEATGESLPLTSTQLADLASVLDEHSTATLDLPILNRDTAWMRSPTTWGKIAAFSLLSVGITASVLNQFTPKQTPIQIATQASSSDQRLTPTQAPQSPPLQANSSLPTQQPPTTGFTPPPIAADSPISTTTTQDPTKTNTSQPTPTEKPKTGNVESTAKPEPKKDSAQNSTQNSKPQLPVENIPAPAAAISKAPISPESARADNQSAEPDPEPPDFTQQIESIQAKIPSQWSPPEKMAGELTYTLEISSDGKILNKNAEGQNLPEAEAALPKVGTTIAAPINSSGKSFNNKPYKVRVFFYPDGTVSVKKA